MLEVVFNIGLYVGSFFIAFFIGFIHAEMKFRSKVCKEVGHDWVTYTVSTGYYSNDIEQAGYCKRCGEDTHGLYHE